MSLKKVLFFGSFWMKENDIVSQILNSLNYLNNFEIVHIDPCLYSKKKMPYIHEDNKVNWISSEYLKDCINLYKPDIIVCCAGGLSPEKDILTFLKKHKIITIGLALSDPDDFEPRSKFYANYFDFFYTNSLNAISLYQQIGVNVKLLPFAVDINYHRNLKLSRIYDVIIVGAGRPDRIEFVKKILKEGISVKCFGSNWYSLYPIFNFIESFFPKFFFHFILLIHNKINSVNGIDQVVALNKGKIYISFALTEAGYTNVKVGLFEAASSGCCVFVEEFDEILNYFKRDSEIILYKNTEDAIIQIKDLLKCNSKLSYVSNNAMQRVARDHTWVSRLNYIFEEINRLK